MLSVPVMNLLSTRSVKVNICLSSALLLASSLFLLQDAVFSVQDTGLIKLVIPDYLFFFTHDLGWYKWYCSIFSLIELLWLVKNGYVLNSHTVSFVAFQKSAGCAIYAMLQHYLWLVVFCWMIIEGTQMYLSLVQVFDSHISRYMPKFSIAAWNMLIFNL